MFGFYKKVSLFVLSFFILNGVVHFLFLKIVNSNSIIQRDDRLFFESIEQTEYVPWLVIGDSHANAVKAESAHHVYRFNSPGESFIQSYYKLKYLVDRDFVIKNLVLPLDLHSLSSFRTDRIINDIYWVKYVDYIELADKKKNRSYIVKYLIANFFSYQGKGNEIFEYLQKRYGLFRPADRRESLAVTERINYHFENCRSVDEDILFYFKEILQLCEKSKIKVVFLKYPVSKDYYEGARVFVDPAQYYSHIDSVITDFKSLNFEIWDYHNLYFDSLQYFMDADHLNNKGSQEFTKLFASRISEFYEN